MNTPTHLLINWSVARPLAKWLGLKQYPLSAVLLGSIAPDLPLYGLVFSGAFWFGWVKQWPAKQVAQHMFDNLFFNDPIWISLHNLLHSPTFLGLAIMGVCWFCRAKQNDQAALSDESAASDKIEPAKAGFWKSWLGGFLASCLLHTAVDIPVHHDDGPLIFWPLQWSYRYMSPLSYWDPNHYGGTVMLFEAVLFFGLLGWLIYLWQSQRNVREPV